MMRSIKRLLSLAVSDNKASVAGSLVPVNHRETGERQLKPSSQKHSGIMTLNSRLELREDGGTRVLVDNQSGSITTCNDTAWTILNALKSGTSVQAIHDSLCSLFQVTEEHAQQDTQAFLKYLGDLGYLQENF